MNPKKIHEVTRLSSYIQSKSLENGLHKCLDIGSGQGYLFARPLDAADARALMTDTPLRLSVA